jgi:hypothetical protein
VIQNHLEPEQANDGATLEAIYQLRVAVWQSVTPQASSLFPDGRLTDSHDFHSLHWVIRDGAQVLAAARLCVHHSIAELPDAQLYSDYIELPDRRHALGAQRSEENPSSPTPHILTKAPVPPTPYFHRSPIASFNRLVVHPSAQCLGFSKKLDWVRRQTAVELGCRAIFVYCSQLSGEARLRSLERQGFRPLAPKNSKVYPPFGATTPLVLLLDQEKQNLNSE